MTTETSVKDEPIGNVQDALTIWSPLNLKTGSLCKIVIQEKQVGVVKTVDEMKDGKTTGRKIKVYHFNVEVGKLTKRAKFGKQSMENCISKWGDDATKWSNKELVVTHAEARGNKYLIFTPLEKLDTS